MNLKLAFTLAVPMLMLRAITSFLVGSFVGKNQHMEYILVTPSIGKINDRRFTRPGYIFRAPYFCNE